MKTETEVMFHVTANRKLCNTREVIDSLKLKAPGFWEKALTPSGKKICVVVVYLLRDFQWEFWKDLEFNLE